MSIPIYRLNSDVSDNETYSGLTYSQKFWILASWIREERIEKGMTDQDGDDLCRGLESASTSGDESLCENAWEKTIENVMDYCEYWNISFKV